MLRLAFAGLLASTLLAAPLHAVPAFARRYGLTCAACHDPFPKLTAFGEAFMANGYSVTPGGDTVGATTNGDELLWLLQTIPLAMRLDAYARYVTGPGARSDLQTPYVAKILSGGPIARNVSYYIYLLLAEEGRVGPLEDANVTFSELFGAPVSVTAGQFQVIDPIWKRELRITREDYAILRHRPGEAVASLTYDRGLLATFAPTASTTIFGELVNGNGIGEAPGGAFDSDGAKSGFVAVTQQVGGVRLSLLGYSGNQRVVPTGQTATVTNRTRMAGPAVQFGYGPFDVGAQWLYRDDTNPGFSGLPVSSIARGGFVELAWWPRGRGGRWLVTGLYNAVDATGLGADYESATVNLSWLRARNLRMATEATWDPIAEKLILSMGFVTAF
jgi:hypothetical protein